MAPPPLLIRKQIWLPYTDLNLEGLSPGRRYTLFDDVGVVLAVLAAGRSGEPQLIDTDGAGSLRISGLAGKLALGQATSTVAGVPTVDGLGQAFNQSWNALWAGSPAFVQRASDGFFRAVSEGDAARLAVQSSNLSMQVSVPGEWTAQSNPAAGAQASASQAAGAAGVRHVGRRVSFGFSSQAVLAGVSTVTFNLRDGATGAGTIKEAWTFDLPAAIIAPFAVGFEVNVLGTSATAMTLETAAAVAGLRVFTNLSGYDAG